MKSPAVATGIALVSMALALARAGFDVAALDMRGHGDSGPRGEAAYVDQLKHDEQDFTQPGSAVRRRQHLGGLRPSARS